MKWRELEKQGVRRCCGIFSDNSQCRKRAVLKDDGTYKHYCEKHQKTMDAYESAYVTPLVESGMIKKY